MSSALGKYEPRLQMQPGFLLLKLRRDFFENFSWRGFL